MNWTNKEIEILKDNYGKIKVKDFKLLLPNRSISSIIMKGNRLKLQPSIRISRKINNWNEDFFHIPNEINSYWAGFLAADGNMNYKSYTISLYQSELDVINRFKNILNSNNKIGSRVSTSGKNNYYISVNSNKIIGDLIYNYSIIPKKSLKLRPPRNLNYNNSLSYIIGLIDGDGCIGIYTKNNKQYLSMTIVGAKYLLKWVKNILNNLPHICKKGNVYQLKVTHNMAEKCLKLLYNHKLVKEHRLKRKWDKLDNWNWKY